MTVNRAVTAFAGFMVLLSLALAWALSPWFLGLTAFVGANLLQSAFMLIDWCDTLHFELRADEDRGGGKRWVVDMDLEKFFDRVDQDLLMGLVAKRVGDHRLLRLIRGFLSAGVLAPAEIAACATAYAEAGK